MKKVLTGLLVASGAWIVCRGEETTNLQEPAITAAKRDHWAYRVLRTTQPLEVKNAAWVRNPIDRFILAKLEAAGLEPMPPADRVTLIRRVTVDLTGLPPTPEDVEAFERDDAPDAYEKLIDRLLESPAYGERWAQHWLDLARFAETDGFEHDLVRPNAWRYRDWVIEALNADMPYDEFVRMQIAGDELRRVRETHQEQEADSLVRSTHPTIATGFLLAGPDMPDINLQDERRHNVLNEMTATVGSVFLGLQIGCAQCHDHKFDPISITDFYRLRAFFDPAEFFDEAPLATPEELAERERLESPLKAQRDRIDKELKKFDDTAHERLNKDPQVKIKPEELLSVLSETEREQYRRLTDELKQLKTTNLPPLPMGRVMREKPGTPRPSHVMLRGDFRQPGPRVEPGFPSVLSEPPLPPGEGRGEGGGAGLSAQQDDPHPNPLPKGEGIGSGRRTVLAQWLTRPDNPLTARVIVNRVWQWHFGAGLVRTPSDFGKMGEPPSHPELLDWLATEFTRSSEAGGCGWSLKKLHKLMLTSATYVQASRPTDAGWTPEQRTAATENWKRSREVDPENRLLGRMNRLRLDGEAIRDAMLAVGDRLSPRRGGPGVMPPLPQELVATLLKGQWTVSQDEEDHRRRSIYVFVRRNLRYPIFDVFDRPDTNASCPQRNRSTTAPQALTLVNSQLALAAARDFAGLVISHAGAGRTAQIELCYRRALGRAPDRAERAAAEKFLASQTDRLTTEQRPPDELALPAGPLPGGVDPYAAAALTDFCHAVFNLNEFIYVD